MNSSESEISESENHEKSLLDVEDAKLRPSSGVIVQTIPKRWIKRRDLALFFGSDLEIVLLKVDGVPQIEIRVKPKGR